ncbi:MAG: hypothetical protein MZV64_30115 [Ignavibacteriales bacterium]|nr:hypothetical protein [Ignavibacteriales bacterium]
MVRPREPNCSATRRRRAAPSLDPAAFPGSAPPTTCTRAPPLFAGVHRGFAPPRTEDVIDNTGGVVDLDAELSWNCELGVRATRDATACGSTPPSSAWTSRTRSCRPAWPAASSATLTSAGRTLHQGLELLARLDLGTLTRSANNLFLRGWRGPGSRRRDSKGSATSSWERAAATWWARSTAGRPATGAASR